MRRLFLSLGLMALALSAFALGDGASQDARGSTYLKYELTNWADSAAEAADRLDAYSVSGATQGVQQRLAVGLAALANATNRLINADGSSCNNFEDISRSLGSGRSVLLPAVQQAREGRLSANQASQTATGLRRAAAQVRGFVIDGNCADEAE